MTEDADPGRSRAYGLLSRLLLRGATGADSARSEELPGMDGDVFGRHDPDLIVRDGEILFEHRVPPFASVFLEVDGSPGGDMSATLARRRAAVGLGVDSNVASDHLGLELELLSHLSGSRGATGDEDDALLFIDGHLLWWLPALVAAVRRHGSPFWQDLVAAALRLVVGQRRELAGGQPPVSQPPWDLMGLPRDPLDDPTIGLREIAIFLVHPVRSGLFVNEEDAAGPGGRDGPPDRGSGHPALALETAFHAAVARGEVDAVARRLRIIAQDTRTSFRESVTNHGLHAGFVAPWIRRLERTETILGRLGRGEGPLA